VDFALLPITCIVVGADVSIWLVLSSRETWKRIKYNIII